MKLTHEQVLSQVSYDPETGEFRRLVNRPHSPVGSDAATKIDTHGYHVVRLLGQEVRAHRLAWFYMTGEWPKNDIDHRDTVRSNNRWSNLRSATRRQNLANSKISSANTSGSKGVSLYKATGRWQAYINRAGKREHLGFFTTRDEAALAYAQAANEEFGEFARLA